MYKRIAALLMLFTFGLQPPAQQARAGAFATEFTQLLNHGELVMQYIRQGLQLAEEIKQYADMVRNVKQLPMQIFGPIEKDLKDLASIVQGGMALAYSLAGLDAQFKAVYKGYTHTPHAFYKEYKQWAQTTLDTTLGALRAAGLQGDQLASEQAVLDSLRVMASSSDGRMQALQVLGQISEQQVQQLMKLRELMLADLSSKQAYQAAIIQQEAANAAATEKFFTAAPTKGDGKKFIPGTH
jgi:P-type conjugative transfer protein TrbJ